MDDTTLRPATDPSMDLLGDLEKRLGALKEWQRENHDHATEVERRETEVQARRADLETRQAELEAEACRIGEERDAAAAERESLEERRVRLERSEAEVEDAKFALTEERERHHATAAKLDVDREQLAQLREELEARSTGLDDHAEAAERLEARAADLDRRASELAEAGDALDRRAGELDALAAGTEARAAALADRSSELDAFREELEAELQRLGAVEKDLQERAAALEEREAAAAAAPDASAVVPDADGIALAAELAAVSAELETRQAELDEARLGLHAAADRVARLDAALAEAQSAAEAVDAAGSSGPAAPAPAPAAAGSAAVDVDAMRAELDKRAHNLKRAKRKILDLQDQLRQAADTNGESAIFSSGEIDLGEVTDLRMKLEAREQELGEARAKLDAREAEIAKLRVRVEELLKRGGRVGSVVPGDAPDHAERAMQLDELAAQVTADRNRVLERKAQLKTADALIHSRREKIREYIRDFRQNHGRSRGASGAGLDAGRVAQLEQERQTLLEVKRFLQNSEADMVKKWALQKSASLAATLVIAVAAAAAVSWTAAGVIAKPLYQATLTMQVRAAPDEDVLPPGVWLGGYGRDLLSEPVLQEVRNQLDQRDLRLAGTVEGLRTRLAGNLAVGGDRDALEITFTDPDPTLVTPVLDAVGRGLLIHHMATDRRAGRMSDTASMKSEAVLRDRPVKDERFRVFGIILGGFAALALLLAIPARMIAARATPVLREGGNPELGNLDHPSPLAAEAMQAAREREGDDEGDVIKPVFRF